jgi:SAM-dependent methyltransferase
MKGLEGTSQDRFWESAGRIGYGEALFRSKRVEAHVIGKQWQVALATARSIGIPDGGAVLELGCGDGGFAARVLAPVYRRVDAMDKSRAAIDRALARGAPGHVRFVAVDVTVHPYAEDEHWDGAFLMGFLHHIKRHAQGVVSRLSRVAARVVVLEPNGNNPLRKLLERLPSNRQAGEESFGLDELRAIFEACGYRLAMQSSINLFPPFTPDVLFTPVRTLERLVEARSGMHRLCSSRVLGFVAR